jgi:hypothetical protein
VEQIMNGRPLREVETVNNVLPRRVNWLDNHRHLVEASVVMEFLNEAQVSDAFTNARDRVQRLLAR